MRTVLTTLLIAFLFTATTAAQLGPPDHARPVEDEILTRCAPEASVATPI